MANLNCSDVALAAQVKPFVNEAHLFNDAGIAFAVWPPSGDLIEPDAVALACESAAEILQSQTLQPRPNSQTESSNASHDPPLSSDLGSCDLVTEAGDGAAQGEAHLPSRAIAVNAAATHSIMLRAGSVSATSSQAASAESKGVLLARKVWQEINVVAAGVIDQS